MREATSNDKKTVVEIISASFDTNKSINYVVKQDQKRSKRIKLLINYSFYKGMRFGKIYLSSDKKAACILLESNKKKTTLGGLLWNLNLAINCIGLRRVSPVSKREKILKQNHPNENFIHLWYLGVDPRSQHQGIGSEFLKEILEKHKKSPVYLETSSLTNIPFYQKFGFYITKKIDLGYDLFIMRKNA
ncbi:GNAT family N-acetyltransferase [Aquimarina sp. 2-A2]|uniref:GNAT family N-acetyltransferase n=1 Tax=Aquimarina sp. 2-A2 TaxID=3382644 RepID=UPI00387EEB2D